MVTLKWRVYQKAIAIWCNYCETLPPCVPCSLCYDKTGSVRPSVRTIVLNYWIRHTLPNFHHLVNVFIINL